MTGAAGREPTRQCYDDMRFMQWVYAAGDTLPPPELGKLHAVNQLEELAYEATAPLSACHTR